ARRSRPPGPRTATTGRSSSPVNKPSRGGGGATSRAAWASPVRQPMMMRTDVLEPAVTDQGRLGRLYRQHAAGAVRLAFLLTGDRGLAEDLVHDAFVRLAGRFRDLRNPDAFEWYLRRTVVNLARSHFRHARV